ncbi:MAG: UvrD-helicase domain-containing protein [Rhodobacteraceae bacterium]|nr:UvrD-helicase domain-containing protein [Paracoccaceae bacterium]
MQEQVRDLPETPPLGTRPYLQGLNDRQLEAVEQLDGPLLVLAGAGSGKTKTLTTRIAHLLCTHRAWPSEILAVTFTNRAAAEMRNRVEHLAGLKVERLNWLGTFHSICLKILRRHSELAGLKDRFTILDADDQLRLLKQIIKAEGIDEKRWPARQLAAVIEAWKNKCLLPEEVPDKDAHHFNGQGKTLYRQYQDRLRMLNCADFGDLILHVVHFLRDHEDLLEEYRRRFKYILVDEYQDTNTAQYLWLRLIAGGHGNICCVGDDDQSIYGWRGAVVENILRFEQSFPGAKIVRLEQNYRSTLHILGAASAVIANNQSRLGKTLWTDQSGGERLKLIGHTDSASEARWIAQEIEALDAGLGQRPQCRFDDIAVLIRASFQMREIEERFLALGLPYRVVGGPRFYERREIRDALAYFRLLESINDDLAFERIVNTPRRGVGAKSLTLIQIEARESGLSLVEAVRKLLREQVFPVRTAAGLQSLLDGLERWTGMVNAGHDETGNNLVGTAGRILDETGLPDMWMNEKTPEAEGRLENLKELVKSMDEFDNLQGFLEHVSLVYENLEDSESSKIHLMTLHAAKGLEFPIVFLPGWEEDIFPSRRAVEDIGRGLEEERRLAYVGITRARQLCYVSFSAARFYFGEYSSMHPSRFVDELPTAHVEVLTPPGLFRSYRADGRRSEFTDTQLSGGAGYSSPGFRRLQRRLENPQSKPVAPGVNNTGPAKEFASGDRVFHEKFGYGDIRDVSDDKLVIEFDKAGRKHIIARHVRIADGQGEN